MNALALAITAGLCLLSMEAIAGLLLALYWRPGSRGRPRPRHRR